MNPHTAYLMGIVGSDIGDLLSGMIDNGPLAIAFGTVAGRQSPSQSSLSRPSGRPSTIAEKRK